MLNVGRNVVHRLWNQFQTEGTISRIPGQGRPRVTTPLDDRYLALLATRRKTKRFRSSQQTILQQQDQGFLPQL